MPWLTVIAAYAGLDYDSLRISKCASSKRMYLFCAEEIDTQREKMKISTAQYIRGKHIKKDLGLELL